MRAIYLVILTLTIAAAGCVTKKKAQMEASQAYMNGQQQAMQARMAAQQPQGPTVFVQGPVQNPIVPWREGMTLTQAIVDANYTAFMNPEVVRVLRGGVVAGEFKGIDLLHHQDMDLQAGDTVIVIP